MGAYLVSFSTNMQSSRLYQAKTHFGLQIQLAYQCCLSNRRIFTCFHVFKRLLVEEELFFLQKIS